MSVFNNQVLVFHEDIRQFFIWICVGVDPDIQEASLTKLKTRELLVFCLIIVLDSNQLYFKILAVFLLNVL